MTSSAAFRSTWVVAGHVSENMPLNKRKESRTGGLPGPLGWRMGSGPSPLMADQGNREPAQRRCDDDDPQLMTAATAVAFCTFR